MKLGWGASRRRRTVIALATVIVLGVAAVANAVSSSPNGLQFTDDAGHGGRLSHASVSGLAQIFPPSSASISSVSYYLDDPKGAGTAKVVSAAPFAYELDASKLTPTIHTILGVVTAPSGKVSDLFARFLVAGGTGTGTTPTTGSTATTVPGGTTVTTVPGGTTVTTVPKGTTGGATLPSEVLDLTNWYLTLPVDANGGNSSGGADCKPLGVHQPELATATYDPWFKVNTDGASVVFRSNVEGCTTSNSSYPRSELREMNGADEASWSATSGTHTMNVREAITTLPTTKPQVVGAQIHDSSDDIVEIMADGLKSTSSGTVGLCFRYNGKEQDTCIDDAYVLGTPYDLTLTASGGNIAISYNGTVKATVACTGDGNYFKVGAYTQSNVSKGDTEGAYGEVVVYSLSVTHA